MNKRFNKKTNKIEDFKATTEMLFHPIDGNTQADIEVTIRNYLKFKINRYDMDVEIVDMAITGSRCKGLEDADSDLDIVVEYKGDANESDMFNIFHEDGFTIGGVRVDINPIKKGKTGTLEQYLEYFCENRSYEKIELDTKKGKFIAYVFENDGYMGIRTEFIKHGDHGQNPGRPSVSLELNPDGELQACTYDYTSEDPIETTEYE